MKICLYGAGAIGIAIGARLAAAGHTVSAVARGATLAALRRDGLRLIDGTGEHRCPAHADENPARLGPQDLVVIAVKGPALPAIAAGIAPLLGPDTMVLSAMNGVPWWFFDRPGHPLEGTRLASVDSGDLLHRTIAAPRILGAVVHLAATTPEPGVSRIHFGNRMILGEAAGAVTPRLESLAADLRRGGFDIDLSADIQRDIWFKLWGNMTMNPISALTGATCDRILDDPLVYAFCCAVMTEAAAIGERIGCPIAQTPVERNAITRQLGAFKTSMLQDVEAGRLLEIDALLGVVHEIAGRVGVEVPHTAALLGLTRLFARGRGLHPAAPGA